MEEFTQTATCPQNADSNGLAPIAPANPLGNARENNIGSPLAIIRASLNPREFKLLANLSTFFEIDLTISGYGTHTARKLGKETFDLHLAHRNQQRLQKATSRLRP